jgi:hypothetical protein
MHTAVIEGIPALALGELAIAVEIGLAGAFVDDIVLAWNVMHIELGARNPLLRIVELSKHVRIKIMMSRLADQLLIYHTSARTRWAICWTVAVSPLRPLIWAQPVKPGFT